jgi:hypothetical protein
MVKERRMREQDTASGGEYISRRLHSPPDGEEEEDEGVGHGLRRQVHI